MEDKPEITIANNSITGSLDFSSIPWHPHNWSAARKWRVVGLSSVFVFVASFGSSIVFLTLPVVSFKFNVSAEVSLLSISLFVGGWATGPLLWSPLSEIHGRNIVYNISWLASIAFNVAAAFAHNATTLSMLRFFGGACVSATMTVAGGTLTDMFTDKDKGPAAGLLFMCGFLGPALGPVMGGVLAEYLEDWRWPLRFYAALVVGITPLRLLCEETDAYTLQKKFSNAGNSSGHLEAAFASLHPRLASKVFKIAIFRPVELIIYEPIVLLSSVYCALVYSILYLYMAAYPKIFFMTYGWMQARIGGAFGGIGVGVVLSMISISYANKQYMTARERRGSGIYPEGRLPLAAVAGFTTPISVFWLAWSARPGVHWSVPVLSGVLFGWSMVALFTAFCAYFLDAYAEVAASAIAAQNMMRCVFGCGLMLVAPKLYGNLDNKWATSLIGFIALVFAPLPLIFYKYGEWIRSKSKFKPGSCNVCPEDGNGGANHNTFTKVSGSSSDTGRFVHTNRDSTSST